MKKSLKNSTKAKSIFFLSIALGIALLSLSASKDVKKSNELEKFVKLYKFVPFNIPRNGDGVGTVISFKKKIEAVIAAPNECFVLKELNIDTLEGNLPDFSYVISKENDIEFNTGKIFGDKVKLSAALNDTRVDSVIVSFKDVFEIRTSRISVERQLQKMDELCVKRSLQKDSYLVERVLGVKGIEVKFFSKTGTEISLDAELMKELKLDTKFKQAFQGKSALTFNEPRFIGYRVWDIDLEVGLTESSYSIDSVDVDKTLELKLN